MSRLPVLRSVLCVALSMAAISATIAQHLRDEEAKRNPDYWREDPDDRPLNYYDDSRFCDGGE